MIAYKTQLQYVARNKIQSEKKSKNFFFQRKKFFSDKFFFQGTIFSPKIYL